MSLLSDLVAPNIWQFGHALDEWDMKNFINNDNVWPTFRIQFLICFIVLAVPGIFFFPLVFVFSFLFLGPDVDQENVYFGLFKSLTNKNIQRSFSKFSLEYPSRKDMRMSWLTDGSKVQLWEKKGRRESIFGWLSEDELNRQWCGGYGVSMTIKPSPTYLEKTG